MKTLAIQLAIILILFVLCNKQQNSDLREKIDLKGTWQFQFVENRYTHDFTDTVHLPGTMSENYRGKINFDSTTNNLTRPYTFEGGAWYRKEIVIPSHWIDKHIELILERTKVTKVWIDTLLIGSSNDISIPQIYDLSGKVKAGRHTLTIMVDNSSKLVPVGGSHMYSESTQTNWNGIIGKIQLEASNKTRITDLQIYPDIKKKSVKIKLGIKNEAILKSGTLALKAQLINSNNPEKPTEKMIDIQFGESMSTFEIDYELGNDAQLWSEFNSNLYKMTVVLKGNKTLPIDDKSVNFGLREFKTKGTQFSINNMVTFLRGKHDGCVFPLTGYPPTDVAGWLKIFKIAKSYGINHYRFHSWCPPEAAFEAADLEGIYLQPELPCWRHFLPEDTIHLAFMKKEGELMLKTFGNHPSFVMMSLGNELGGSREILKQFVTDFRNFDNRHLYASGTNNFFWDPQFQEGDDYWSTARTAKETQGMNTDTRSSFAYIDGRESGIINTKYPSTIRDYSEAIANVQVPVVGHEIGQYQIYPDYSEISKYTGVLQARNFEAFRNRLQNAGMADQAEQFLKATGALSVLCYREEIETALRTKNFGGFQLLDLQDYPGQGTALVGILNAFMEDKKVIEKDKWTNFCNKIVPLLLMPKYCYTTSDTLIALIKIANYSDKSLNNQKIQWEISDSHNKSIAIKQVAVNQIDQGSLSSAGEIEFPLVKIDGPQKLKIQIKIGDTQYKNEYNIWVYKSGNELIKQDDIVIVNKLDKNTLTNLKSGRKVLLMPEMNSINNNSVKGMFIPDFWNYSMFKSIAENIKKEVAPGTMGILTNPNHPIFKDFPTDLYTNWQWWAILKNSRAIVLDKTNKSYRPIVQIIDNIDRNHKLGLIFEFKAGQGKLLVCSSRLLDIADKPEARQLYNSIINYMKSEKFKPESEIDEKGLKELIR